MKKQLLGRTADTAPNMLAKVVRLAFRAIRGPHLELQGTRSSHCPKVSWTSEQAELAWEMFEANRLFCARSSRRRATPCTIRTLDSLWRSVWQYRVSMMVNHRRKATRCCSGTQGIRCMRAPSRSGTREKAQIRVHCSPP